MLRIRQKQTPPTNRQANRTKNRNKLTGKQQQTNGYYYSYHVFNDGSLGVMMMIDTKQMH